MSGVTSGTASPHHYHRLSSSPPSMPKCKTDQPDSAAVGIPAHHEEHVSLINARYVAF